MKNIKILLLFISLNSISQTYPIIEEFNPGTSWNFTNGAGIQNYGNTQNYASTNLGNTPYPNSSTITISSPIYSFTNCNTDITVNFPISGRIENNWDFLRFQYWNGVSWITQQSYTGNQNTLYSYILPNTVTRFRFLLITDATVNTYFSAGSTKVYYYDIANFIINCSIVLPVELLSFNIIQDECFNIILWSTISEINNDYFELEKSNDAINFKKIFKINSFKNSLELNNYIFVDKEYNESIVYYRLKQVDLNSDFKYSKIVSIDNLCTPDKLLKIINLLGQEVTDEYPGVKLYIYKNKIKKY